MTEDRKRQIMDYLNKAGVRPSLGGYGMFINIISISIEEPELSCYELFDKFACDKEGRRLTCEESQKMWDRNYKCCRYALKASKSLETSVYGFIRACAVELGGAP